MLDKRAYVYLWMKVAVIGREARFQALRCVLGLTLMSSEYV